MVKGEQNHRKTIDANGSRGKKTSYPIAPRKWPLFTSSGLGRGTTAWLKLKLVLGERYLGQWRWCDFSHETFRSKTLQDKVINADSAFIFLIIHLISQKAVCGAVLPPSLQPFIFWKHQSSGGLPLLITQSRSPSCCNECFALIFKQLHKGRSWFETSVFFSETNNFATTGGSEYPPFNLISVTHNIKQIHVCIYHKGVARVRNLTIRLIWDPFWESHLKDLSDLADVAATLWPLFRQNFFFGCLVKKGSQIYR